MIKSHLKLFRIQHLVFTATSWSVVVQCLSSQHTLEVTCQNHISLFVSVLHLKLIHKYTNREKSNMAWLLLCSSFYFLRRWERHGIVHICLIMTLNRCHRLTCGLSIIKHLPLVETLQPAEGELVSKKQVSVRCQSSCWTHEAHELCPEVMDVNKYVTVPIWLCRHQQYLVFCLKGRGIF